MIDVMSLDDDVDEQNELDLDLSKDGKRIYKGLYIVDRYSDHYISMSPSIKHHRRRPPTPTTTN